MQAETTLTETNPQSKEANTFARYTIHIPAHDKDGKLLHHILPTLRKSMTQSGLHGRMVIRGVEADWGDDSQSVHQIIVDAVSSPDSDQKIKDIAKSAKELGELDGVYVTKHPLEYWIV